ncbi:tetratricopeptide repeat protein [uncultured Psychroserpens sp.]|uniref:tetratricopeptide repeat protein n=1 Tax=uncultured Psychroserpens sp. TaxID=255436 RepID=UPI002614ABCC|nr:tetratricopeptide repeat protein [uncultured Psychroserpens sp.]
MKITTLLLCLLCFNFSFSQDDINDLVKQGITYHDAGDYDKAIATYKEALKIDSKSSLVNYELSLSYFYNKDFKNAIKYSDVVIDNDKEHVKAAYITKGSSLDNLGKIKESIKLFKKGIKKFKTEGLLYYNLALNYYKLKDFDEAEEVITQGITQDQSHASSHLMLGYLNYDKNKRAQSLLNLHYFLLLEPATARSQQAAGLIQTMMSSNVNKDDEKPNTINISLSLPDEDDEFSAAELMISMLEASKSLEENEGKSEDELFIENTDSFFTILGELKDKKSKGIYWDVYVNFFYELAKSDHMPAYCYYVMQSVNKNSQTWLDSNTDALDAFDQWLQNN